MSTRIQLRHDTAANWTGVNPTLAAGEAGVETNTSKLKLGDGSTAWNSLGYVGGGGTTGTPTQVLYFDGSGNPVGSANLTFDSGTKTIQFSGLVVGIGDQLSEGNSTRISLNDSSGTITFSTSVSYQPYFSFNATSRQIIFNNTNGQVEFGDYEGNNNGTRLKIDDDDAAQTVSMGDLYGISTGATLTVDILNGIVTSNVDIECTDAADGLILKDRTTATRYRLFVDSGVLDIETV